MSDVLENLAPTGVKGVMKAVGASSGDLWMVPPDQLHVIEGFNVRVENAAYKAHTRRLADSMKANGYYRHKPMKGYVAKDAEGNAVIYITDGHTRRRALNIAIEEGASIEAVPVIVAAAGTSNEDLTVGLVTDNDGSPLTPLEIAVVCKRLIGYGLDEKAIAARISRTKQYVSDLLALLAAPAAVRKMVEKDEVSATLAIETLKKHGPKATEVLKSAKETVVASGKSGGKITKKAVEGGNKPASVVGEITGHEVDEAGNNVYTITVVAEYDQLPVDASHVKMTIAPAPKPKKGKKADAPDKAVESTATATTQPEEESL